MRGRVLAMAAPLAAAVAVASIAAASAVISHDAARRPASQRSAAPVPARTPPPYYVALHQLAPATGGWNHIPADAVVRVTATGKTIATVAVPAPYATFVGVSAAYDDRTFVLAAQRKQGNGPTPQSIYPATRLYKLSINPAAQGAGRAVLTPLGVPVIPAGVQFGGMALSPDGTRLAVAQELMPPPFPPRIDHSQHVRVYDLATGRYTEWTGRIRLGSVTGYEQLLSWEENGRFLAFASWDRNCVLCIRRLDTSSAGGSLDNHSVLLVRPPVSAFGSAFWNTVWLTPDGKHVVASAFVGGRTKTYMRIYRFSILPAKLIATIPGPGNGEQVTWSSPAGLVIIAINHGKHHLVAEVIVGKHAAPLPMPLGTVIAAW
jgi:hypothetical protein